MNKISIATYCFYSDDLFHHGLLEVLKQKDDFHFTESFNTLDNLALNLRKLGINILILLIQNSNEDEQLFIKRLKDQQPSIKTLVISTNTQPDILYAIIKSGAKGYMTSHSSKNELFEAIYTLRSGFDYYSKAITELLLKNYIDVLQSEDKRTHKNFKNLSSREIEILEQWGNGSTNKEIADKLFISIRTVESHKNHIMQKLNMKTVVDVVKFAIKNNIINL